MQEQQIHLIQTVIKSLATAQMSLQALIMPDEHPGPDPDPHFGKAEAQMRGQDAEDLVHAQGHDLPKLADAPTETEAVSAETLAQSFLRKHGSRLAGKSVETIVSEFTDYISKPRPAIKIKKIQLLADNWDEVYKFLHQEGSKVESYAATPLPHRELNIKIRDKTITVRFNDWLVMDDDGNIIVEPPPRPVLDGKNE